MLDKLSRKILKYMRDNPDVGETNFNAGIFAIVKGVSEEVALIRPAVGFLKDNGFVDYIHGKNGQTVGFRLSHMGLHHDEFELLETAEKRKAAIVGSVITIVTELVIAGIAYGIGILREAISQLGL